jgi:hypothetical protein
MKPLKDQLEFVSFDLEMKLRVFPEAFLRARSAADRRNLGQITNAKARRGGGAARFVRFHTLPLAKKRISQATHRLWWPHGCLSSGDVEEIKATAYLDRIKPGRPKKQEASV